MTPSTYSMTWDLDVIFPGGSSSKEFRDHLEKVEKEIHSFEASIKSWDASGSEDSGLSDILEKFQKADSGLEQAESFVSCLQAQNTDDVNANELRGIVTALASQLNTALTHLDKAILEIDDSVWKSLVENEHLNELSFILNERRRQAVDKLSKEEEALINDLAVDGYHGWEEMYDAIVSQLCIPFKENGKEVLLSVGQAQNKFSSLDRQVRKNVFDEWEKAWGKNAELIATTLNHLSGFRLAVYKKRGWNDVLKEALEYNRMSKETLDIMWKVISDNKKPFVEFLKRKAHLLGVEKLNWYDLDAPATDSSKTYTYREGAAFIIDHFGKFGDELSKFAEKAFKGRWIEAEDRPGKRPGGFCTSFPLSSQSRIFMTYSDTYENVSTLAHELGHAFHTYAMKDVHPLNCHYAMNVAETASTFAETIVADAAFEQAKENSEKIALLESKIQNSIAFFMNIHARFLFETRFYEERKKGMVSTERLNQLMEKAQKEAYADSLSQYHPYFWGSKLHFYISDIPFYNFPYTFGYLFSLGIYAQAKKEGKGYEEKYISLLKDTGRMTVEELAKKHLGADLTKEDFWQAAVDLCIKDVEEFLELTK
ncbi:MAG TPA: oligoendopeptidase [Bacillus bacterium]|uniref:Oligoendopeptidase n=1 Tax=Siminovitchia fordii TaxID=254759 RepID=A0ABQ4K2X6_9BACI|nr:oligoendopeptidase [Siminovitchia fordii]HBZ09163.1 oligoendopeptidase [Bacillus sp. (in: firmicutes)]